MPERIVIFGARPDGSAKVVLDIVRLAARYEPVGFLDDDRAAWGRSLGGLPVLGGRDRFPQLTADGVAGVICALGSNPGRERILGEARAAGLAAVNAVHPSAIVAGDVELGAGIWIAAGAVINPGTSIGDGAVVNTGATIDHDCRIEPYVNISPGCHLSGRTVVRRYAFLGTGAITLPDAAIGERAVVGAGAVVLRDVPPDTTVVGVPARAL